MFCVILTTQVNFLFIQDLWEEAAKYPLHGMLHDSSSYVFSCINSMAENEELEDENRRICDVRPFCSVLRLIERKGNKAEKSLNNQISHLLGKGNIFINNIINM